MHLQKDRTVSDYMLPTGGPGPKVFREDSEWFVPAVARCAQDRGGTSIPVARALGPDCSIGVSEATILALALLESGCNLSSHIPRHGGRRSSRTFSLLFLLVVRGVDRLGYCDRCCGANYGARPDLGNFQQMLPGIRSRNCLGHEVSELLLGVHVSQTDSLVSTDPKEPSHVNGVSAG
jgi:hypothetical protein